MNGTISKLKRLAAQKAGPNKVASRQPRTSDGRFLKFGGFSFSKRNRRKVGPGNPFSELVRRRLGDKNLSRSKYRAAIARFRSLYQARQGRNRDEAQHGRGGRAATITRVFGRNQRKPGATRKESGFSVAQKEGKLVWQMVASTPYGPDRDGEWVTEKAQKHFVETFTPGIPLVAWHLYDPEQRVGYTLGTVQQAEYRDDQLLLAGDFHSPEIAQAVYEKQDELGASIGFYYRKDSKIGNEYHEAVGYEVSILPAEFASAPFTKVKIGILDTEKQQ